VGVWVEKGWCGECNNSVCKASRARAGMRTHTLPNCFTGLPFSTSHSATSPSVFWVRTCRRSLSTCVYECVCVCLRACVRACVHVHVYARLHARASGHEGTAAAPSAPGWPLAPGKTSPRPHLVVAQRGDAGRGAGGLQQHSLPTAGRAQPRVVASPAGTYGGPPPAGCVRQWEACACGCERMGEHACVCVCKDEYACLRAVCTEGADLPHLIETCTQRGSSPGAHGGPFLTSSPYPQ